MHECLQAAEVELRKRQRLFSEDHGGTAEERQSIVDAINGMNVLCREATEWKHGQMPGGADAQPD
jgi:hypothetical protein